MYDPCKSHLGQHFSNRYKFKKNVQNIQDGLKVILSTQLYPNQMKCISSKLEIKLSQMFTFYEVVIYSHNKYAYVHIYMLDTY